MARALRIDAAGTIHHAASRGYERHRIFYDDAIARPSSGFPVRTSSAEIPVPTLRYARHTPLAYRVVYDSVR